MLTVLYVYDVQVAVMQQELTALQPELIETAKQTDQMMVKIEKETVEVDAKKKLVSADEKVANDAAAAAKAIKVADGKMENVYLRLTKIIHAGVWMQTQFHVLEK